jgi:transcriptional regulator with GAF, ATPase, and Fis domain
MASAAPCPAPVVGESDLYVCLAAIGRALEAEFQPRVFLADLSAALTALVPHDRLAIEYIAEDRRTFSVFAEHGAPDVLPTIDRYTTDLEHAARFPAADSLVSTVLGGDVVCVSDLSADPRFAGHHDRLRGLRAAIVVPLVVGPRVIGGVSAQSRVADAYGPVHVEHMRTLGRLIGPFIETIALLYRERRRRHRIGLLPGVTKMLGTTLDLREILAPVGEAVRPAIAFDAMGVIILDTSSWQWAFFGTAGEPPVPGIERVAARDFSYGPALIAGDTVLFEEASREVNLAFAGDRVLLTAGLESCLWVPMRFGDEVGGALFFGKHEPHWYDAVDVEVASVIASSIVLAIQHQRLAEEQRRLASMERHARTLERTLKSARRELHQRYGFDQIIGRSPVLREVLDRAAQVAPTETTVLITGESGTGKELVARAIHYASPRADGPFVAVNCAALPDTLLESELFGHERGAFTGADRQKPGRFELAAGGTLFLDEIGDLSTPVQVKLLRVLQEREYQRLGGTATLKANIRLIAATNRDLIAEMAAGRFRSDLFYRLSVFNVHLPPLRERGDDVLLLADSFIRDLAPRMAKGDVTLSRDALDVLRRHAWPGNIREVQNAVERGLISCDGALVTAAHLGIAPTAEPTALAPPAVPPAARPVSAAASPSLQDVERSAILAALERAHGQKSRAAALLGLTRFQLYTRLKRHGIDVPRD